jgi:hypothetical protein
VIFSRRRGSGGRHHRADDPRPARSAGDRGIRDDFDDDIGGGAEEASPPGTTGPYDVADAPADVERLDLGSLQIPAIAGVEVRVQADPDGQVQQVILVAGENALQLGVFAAPRSEGIWDEVREDIRKQLVSDGVGVEEIDGSYGVELRSRVRSPEGVTDIRFVGIDGPRWMVRGVYQGPAAADPSLAGPLAECLAGVVVDRGTDAMPVREPLPLRLPREVTEHAQVTEEEAKGPGPAVNGAPPHAPESGGTRPRQSPRSKSSTRPRRRG